MAQEQSPMTLDRVQAALAAGDTERLRETVLALSEAELEQLAVELGEHTVARLTRSARGPRRGRKRGRVVVIHGIMGSLLDSVDASGDADRVWINFLRLIAGRIADLELDAAGRPARSDLTIRTVGLIHKVYAPLILELDRQWHVRPVAFDWREDLDRSAERLADEIRSFGQGQPVHIVAHSMGGLVSRRFLQLHPELWASMRDPQGEAGGRLVMLGTPNRGSYAIPLALSGQEKMVKWLARFDLKHDRTRLLGILNTFPGSYEMLPSPVLELGDDHGELFTASRWGDLPIQPKLLQRAAQLLKELEQAVDPERFVYVAGYDRDTPFLIRIVKDGKFELQKTRDGDGRVPHRLGLLPGVNTFWVDEIHGDLPKNDEVLDSVHDLLAQGETAHLFSSKPARRALGEPEAAKWIPVEDVDPLPEEAEAILTHARRSGSRGEPKFAPGDEAALEALVFGDWLGGADVLRSRGAAKARAKQKQQKKAAAPKLEIEVCWGDITKVDADVYAVGHYQRVLPQNAEWKLDCVVSGIPEGDASVKPGDARLVISQHTRRGSLRGAVGDLYYFPWGDRAHRDRIVAVAGMGYPGSFGASALRRLTRGLALGVGSLPNVERACTVLIGSGAGTLSIRDSVRGLLRGLADAVATGRLPARVRAIQVVELYRDRAREILEELREEARDESLADVIKLEVKPKLAVRGGRVGDQDALSLALAATLRAASQSAQKNSLARIVAQIPERHGMRESVSNLLGEKGGSIRADLDLRALGYRVEPIPDRDSYGVPTRIAVFEHKQLLRAAAITRTTTVAERILPAGLHVVEELTTQTNDPESELEDNAPSNMTRLLFPRDFRDLLRGDGPFVFEVDRTAAQIHWEILSRDVDSAPVGPPISTQVPVARQLRTEYSPAPEHKETHEGPLRALVIGDPGDPKEGYDLPGARREALEVLRLLKETRGVEVVALIGAPNADRGGIPRSVEPATLTGALDQLLNGSFDLLHYCGHGDFDPEDPTLVGWVFGIGMLTAREIRALDRVPSLIVANACLSARTSRALEGGRSFREGRTEAGLLPSLADEFFHLGLRNYVGTAWEVNDAGAVRFARRLYAELLKPERPAIGEAVLAARKELHERRSAYGKLWAAYQHYGDPTVSLRRPTDAGST